MEVGTQASGPIVPAVDPVVVSQGPWVVPPSASVSVPPPTPTPGLDVAFLKALFGHIVLDGAPFSWLLLNFYMKI